MLTCEKCGFENPDGVLFCAKCGAELEEESDTDSETFRIEMAQEIQHQPRWGTARLGEHRRLFLHIRGFSQPLIIDLRERLVVGRFDPDHGEQPDILLDEYHAQEEGVSRRHAAFLVEDNALKLTDLGSANATYLNGIELTPYQKRIMRDGDEVRLGNLVMQVRFA
ncbi:MAG TPA: FHA domain-containing protein [Aggregatilinea sp.]|uniref:FHA domain-containing protein n=1 Tax=Aggregatilinea sp. TaxID=2806333 RepID=UPI002B6C1FBF|nr:FHA domain-containing protein [Aggregatilinea sp.]HML20423.1 FHA domain-containing protein [Aggregatilinea sp.]